MAKCMLCTKGPHAGNNVPKSQHKTRRTIQPNIQKVDGIRMCTRCLRTLKRVAQAQPALATAQ
ncbi:MAG: bL28 family ribosomal protein [bacterium]